MKPLARAADRVSDEMADVANSVGGAVERMRHHMANVPDSICRAVERMSKDVTNAGEGRRYGQNGCD